MQEVKKRKKRKKKISKIMTLLLLLVILVFFVSILYLNVIPLIWTILGFIVALFITYGITLLNFSRKKGFRLIGYFFSIVIITIIIYISTYLFNTIGFLFNVTNGDYTLKNYNVLVIDDKFKSLKDLDNLGVGINETSLDETLKKVQKKIDKKVKVNYKYYEDSNTLVTALTEQEIDAIILEDNELELLKETDVDIYNSLKNIYEIEMKDDIKNIKEVVNINNEPFNIYISGIDTFGKINSTSRSDVNILLTINPKTEKILITWIPRDYYVKINNSSYKDKLTHAGMYGIDTSIYAIEKLLDTNINYYVKVNFSSIINIVDVLEGITVYNDEAFRTDDGQLFSKGNITLNGKKALTFVRERHHVSGGDLGRGKNQIKVLEALINKAMSKEIITKYNKLLNSLDGSFVTNMNQNTMLGFIKKEIQSPRDWQIESNTLSGTDASEITYTYKNKNLYVMIPDEEVVNTAKNKIKSILND